MSHSQNRSIAWTYFDRLDEVESAKCKKCQSVLKCKKYSTTGLLRHLRSAHNEILGEIQTVEHSQKKRKKETERADTLEEIVAKLVCVDGFSIHAIVNSDFIKNSLAKKGMLLPTNSCHVMNMIHYQYNTVKTTTSTDITARLLKGERFSISLDEYTSLRNQRYLNINLHAPDKILNLGMVRIKGSLSAAKTVEVVETKLAEFDICMKSDVVASVTDGASAMINYGRLSNSDHHLCYAHGLHLAVCDVLYNKKVAKAHQVCSCDSSFTHYFPDPDIDEEDNDTERTVVAESVDSDDEIENTDELSTIEIDNPDNYSQGKHIELNDSSLRCGCDINIANTIEKVRKIVKIFRKSPLKNEILQKYVNGEHGKDLQLKLDRKTRWDSLLDMVERFLATRRCISKAMIDTGLNLDISDGEFDVLAAILSSLQPIRLAVERLGRRDATLLSAEGVFRFILEELEKQNTFFSAEVKQAVQKRIGQRRNQDLIGLVMYLHNPVTDKEKITPCHPSLLLPPIEAVQTTARNLFARLFNSDLAESHPVSSESNVSDFVDTESGVTPVGISPSSSKQQTLRERLDNAVKDAVNNDHVDVKLHAKTTIVQEMKIYMATGKRTPNLNLLYNALTSIPPTSVGAERAFSAVGLFVPKLRTQLSDQSIDRMCFLKRYFESKMAR